MKFKVIDEDNWKNYLIKSEQFYETAGTHLIMNSGIQSD